MKHQWAQVIVHAMLVGLAAGCSDSTALKIGDIPVDLRVPPGAVLAQRAHAAGVQIYRCSAAKDGPARFSWTLKQPEAELFDHAGASSIHRGVLVLRRRP